MLAFLRSVPGEHITVKGLREIFAEREISVGTATIYRHLERMVKEGSVAKYIIDDKNGACYEYLGEGSHCHKPVCFHCKCEKCGKLIHLECSELAHISEHLKDDHDFLVDPSRFVIYGVCGECGADGG